MTADPPDQHSPPADEAPASTTTAVVEDKTQPYRLKELAAKLAQRRRRTTGAELTFKRQRADVRVPLDRGEMVIGRDVGCDIVLVDKSASLRHARILRSSGGYFELEDLSSTNGVIVDGERVARMTLQDGDTFTVGDTRFSILIAAIVGEEAG